MALEIGSRVGPYEITAEIGAGGMGVVYRARDTLSSGSSRSRSLTRAFRRKPTSSIFSNRRNSVRSPWLFCVSWFPRFYSVDGLISNARFEELCRHVLPDRSMS
jgi:serine/threonine protein kinase